MYVQQECINNVMCKAYFDIIKNKTKSTLCIFLNEDNITERKLLEFAINKVIRRSCEVNTNYRRLSNT